MAAVHELEKYIEQAAKLEELNLLPPNPSFFQKKTFEIVTDVVEMELDGPGFQAVCKETLERLLPLVGFLTQPRSIAEFQVLKETLLEIVWKYDPYLRFKRGELSQGNKEEQTVWVVDWLSWLLPECAILPRNECDNLEWHPPDEVWQSFEMVADRPFRPAGEKIVSLQKASDLAKQARQEGRGRVGYAVGKWRFGSHSEHISLFEHAKEALGTDGLLIVGVESQSSTWQRRGKNHFVLSDKERLLRIAGLGAVDLAILHAPSEGEIEDLEAFYSQVQKELDFDLWFIGTKDNLWRDKFEAMCREMGAILLWDRPTTSISTTEIIKQIKAAC